jgi:hypothetical protein
VTDRGGGGVNVSFLFAVPVASVGELCHEHSSGLSTTNWLSEMVQISCPDLDPWAPSARAPFMDM